MSKLFKVLKFSLKFSLVVLLLFCALLECFVKYKVYQHEDKINAALMLDNQEIIELLKLYHELDFIENKSHYFVLSDTHNKVNLGKRMNELFSKAKEGNRERVILTPEQEQQAFEDLKVALRCDNFINCILELPNDRAADVFRYANIIFSKLSVMMLFNPKYYELL